MIDNVIVTVIYRDQRFDMELPANVPAERLRPALAAALQTKGFFPTDPLELVCNGQTLKDADTFLRSGVWDGCCLELRDRGRRV